MTAPVAALSSIYKDWQQLGQSPLGETWRARQCADDRLVTIKIQPISDRATAAVAREVRVMQSLRHPALQDFIRQEPVDGQLGLVYDFVDGPTLEEVLRQDGKLQETEAIQIALALLSGLEALHVAGFIHRDISPQNVVLGPGREPVLIDFNALGHLTEQSNIGATTLVGEYSGKPLYMTPEQFVGAPQSQSVDVWAIGALLYEMIAGRPLRKSQSLVELVSEVNDPRPLDLSAVPTSYRAVLTRFLAADAGSRPNATEAGRLLSAVLHTEEELPELSEFSDLLSKDFGVSEADDFSDAFAVPDTGSPQPSAAPDPFGPASTFAKDQLGTKNGASPNVPDHPVAQSMPRSKGVRGFGLWFVILLAVGFGAALYWAGILSGSDHVPEPSPPPEVPVPASPPLDNNPFWHMKYAAPAGLFAFGIALMLLGLVLSRRFESRAATLKTNLPFEAATLMAGPNARDQLTQTILVEIDAFHALAGHGPDQMLTVTMVALANEYKEAGSADERMKALQMLLDLQSKIASRLRPWWLDYETLVARGISLVGLAAGGVALFEAVQRLL